MTYEDMLEDFNWTLENFDRVQVNAVLQKKALIRISEGWSIDNVLSALITALLPYG